MELTEIHPGILIIYYLLLALFAFLFSNPYYMITFIVLMLFLIYLQGIRSELVNVLKIFIPLGILIMIINPLFVYEGTHRIYLWGSYFITLEACVYGVLMAGTFLIVLLALSSYNKSVSYQEMLYILSKKLPIIAMILVMALRFIPLLNSRAIEVEKLYKLDSSSYLNSNINLSSDSKFIKKVSSNERSSKMIDKAKNMGSIIAVTIAWSLEEAMFTAKSMKARGYNATGRTSYLSFKLKMPDYAFIAMMILCLVVLAIGLSQGYGYINVYPSLNFSFHDLPLNIYYLAFVVFLLPLIYLELREVWIWH